MRKRKQRRWQNIRQSLFDFCTEHHRETLLTQWNTARNAPLTPQAVTYGSHKRVWWRCERGHDYEAMVSARVWGSGCPYCAGRRVQAGENDFAARFPRLAAQWHPTLNGTLLHTQVTAGCRRKVWWLCPENHTWKAVIYSRTGTQQSGCPVCAGKTRQRSK